jgi:4-hydroxy-tetrahydrodipicolinate synthase
VSNVAPAKTVEVYDLFEAGRVREAGAAFRQLYPLVDFLFSDTNPVPCKAALAELGLCNAEARLPLSAFDGSVPSALIRRLA